jgi:hypothetical protein
VAASHVLHCTYPQVHRFCSLSKLYTTTLSNLRRANHAYPRFLPIPAYISARSGTSTLIPYDFSTPSSLNLVILLQTFDIARRLDRLF